MWIKSDISFHEFCRRQCLLSHHWNKTLFDLQEVGSHHWNKTLFDLEEVGSGVGDHRRNHPLRLRIAHFSASCWLASSSKLLSSNRNC
jgi:hypothetical protein